MIVYKVEAFSAQENKEFDLVIVLSKNTPISQARREIVNILEDRGFGNYEIRDMKLISDNVAHVYSIINADGVEERTVTSAALQRILLGRVA